MTFSECHFKTMSDLTGNVEEKMKYILSVNTS